MPVSIAVLDVMMPEMDGFQLAEKILLDSPEIPFVFLTARKLKEDKLKGLRLGADDYIVKPFDADILVLKLRNILKRSQKQVSAEVHEKILLGSYQLDLKNYYLERNGKIQKITEKEAALMSYLFRHKNRLLKREQILQDLWGNDDFFSGRDQEYNQKLIDVRNEFEKYNLISAIHTLKSKEDKIFKNLLPPSNILDSENENILLQSLKKLDFKINSQLAA